MQITLLDAPTPNDWLNVLNVTRSTVNKGPLNKQPSDDFKHDLLRSEHSPLRLLTYLIQIQDIPYWVSVHLVRHKIGTEHFISTQRTDRTQTNRNKLPQDAPVTHTIALNAEAIINISRKRLCRLASPETRITWFGVLKEIGKHSPELIEYCVPNCIYRGGCKEFKPCGFEQTNAFDKAMQEYRGY